MVNFYTLLRLLAAALLGVVIANRAFAQDTPWPKAEDWIGKKPSEIIHTAGSPYEPQGISFYGYFTYPPTGGRASPLWGGLVKNLKITYMEQPIRQIGRYLVFVAYDCGNKVCHEGFAFAYNLDTKTPILCVQKRQHQRKTYLKPEEIEALKATGKEEEIYRYRDELEIRTEAADQGHAWWTPPTYVNKIGYGISCGGTEADASNYQKVLDHLLLAEKLLP